MSKNLLAAIMLALCPGIVFGQAFTFQDGVTELPGGGLYDGTIDTEFRAAHPTTPQGGNPSTSVGQFDVGFQMQL